MRNDKPCGCEQGGIGLIIGALCCGAYFLLTGGWSTASHGEIWLALGWLVLTTGIGKLIGIRWETHRLRRQSTYMDLAGQGEGIGTSHSAVQKFWDKEPAGCCGRR